MFKKTNSLHCFMLQFQLNLSTTKLYLLVYVPECWMGRVSLVFGIGERQSIWKHEVLSLTTRREIYTMSVAMFQLCFWFMYMLILSYFRPYAKRSSFNVLRMTNFWYTYDIQYVYILNLHQIMTFQIRILSGGYTHSQ